MEKIFTRPGVYAWTLLWRHNGPTGVSNHQPRDCLLNRLFRYRTKKTSKLRLTGLCEGNSPVTGEFPAQRASIAENVSTWWRHHGSGLVVKVQPMSAPQCQHPYCFFYTVCLQWWLNQCDRCPVLYIHVLWTRSTSRMSMLGSVLVRNVKQKAHKLDCFIDTWCRFAL